MSKNRDAAGFIPNSGKTTMNSLCNGVWFLSPSSRVELLRLLGTLQWWSTKRRDEALVVVVVMVVWLTEESEHAAARLDLNMVVSEEIQDDGWMNA